jgi:hypothetical protein
VVLRGPDGFVALHLRNSILHEHDMPLCLLNGVWVGVAGTNGSISILGYGPTFVASGDDPHARSMKCAKVVGDLAPTRIQWKTASSGGCSWPC